jgi:hypothetical protein
VNNSISSANGANFHERKFKLAIQSRPPIAPIFMDEDIQRQRSAFIRKIGG